MISHFLFNVFISFYFYFFTGKGMGDMLIFLDLHLLYGLLFILPLTRAQPGRQLDSCVICRSKASLNAKPIRRSTEKMEFLKKKKIWIKSNMQWNLGLRNGRVARAGAIHGLSLLLPGFPLVLRAFPGVVHFSPLHKTDVSF